MGPFVGGIEIICGALVIFGLHTTGGHTVADRLTVAIFSTKVPVLLGLSGDFHLQNGRATDCSADYMRLEPISPCGLLWCF